MGCVVAPFTHAAAASRLQEGLPYRYDAVVIETSLGMTFGELPIWYLFVFEGQLWIKDNIGYGVLVNDGRWESFPPDTEVRVVTEMWI